MPPAAASTSATTASLTPINHLSIPKNTAYICELCGASATLICATCRCTYYCQHEHQQIDFYGIHEKICHLVAALASSRSTVGNEKEREKRQNTIELTELSLSQSCLQEALRHLRNEKFEFAFAAALQNLKWNQKIYNENRHATLVISIHNHDKEKLKSKIESREKSKIELIQSLLLLAEVKLGLKDIKESEKYLLEAHWAILSNINEPSSKKTNSSNKKSSKKSTSYHSEAKENANEQTSNSNELFQISTSQSPLSSLRGKLYRLFGKVYCEEDRFDEAIKAYSHDVYYNSLEFGCENIETSHGYYGLGLVFYKLSKLKEQQVKAQNSEEANSVELERAFALFDKFVEIWLRFLINLRQNNEKLSDYLHENAIADVSTKFRLILQIRRQILGELHVATGEIYYLYGLFKLETNYEHDAKFLLESALSIYSSGNNNSTSTEEHEYIPALRLVLQEISTKKIIVQTSPLFQLQAEVS